MRILTVGTLYPPHHEGGYELSWQGAVGHLRRAGHHVRVLAADHRRPGVADGPEPDVRRELRLYWRDHAFLKPGWRARIALERANAAALEHALESIEVAVAFAMGGLSLSLLERLRRRGVPTLAVVEDDWLLYGPRADRWLAGVRRLPPAAVQALTGLPARVPFGACARYLFVSEHTRRRALEHHRLTDSAVLPIGIAPEFQRARAVGGWGGGILYAGRLDPRKGVADAILALPEEMTLRVIGRGEGAYEAELRDLAAGRPVAFEAARDAAELAEAYARADVVVFPVRWEEPFGLVPLEAMGIGRPVIATGLGGSGEFLRDGENCLLVAPGDPRALAGALRRLAGDPALRERLREGGRRTAERYTAQAFHARLEGELAAIAENGRR